MREVWDSLDAPNVNQLRVPSSIPQAAREEKWLVECEKEALRRDLEHATQRCEQMQRDTRSEIAPGAHS